MIDQKTPNLLLPLPHPANELSDDVLRLRDALAAIDAAVFEKADAAATIAALAGKATLANVATAITDLVDSSPGTLNTLNELATALGDDPNFATTITGLIAAKADSESVAVALATKADALTVAESLSGK